MINNKNNLISINYSHKIYLLKLTKLSIKAILNNFNLLYKINFLSSYKLIINYIKLSSKQNLPLLQQTRLYNFHKIILKYTTKDHVFPKSISELLSKLIHLLELLYISKQGNTLI